MNITITGSLGNVSQPLIEKLVAKGHRVTVISNSPERAKAIEDLHAIAAIGSIEDEPFLIRAFTGADAVYCMIPPNYQTTDFKEFMIQVGGNYARAIGKTGVRHVVNLSSSLGTHLPDGPGLAAAFHLVEKGFDQSQTNVLHLRPGMFYTNFYGNMEMIKHSNIIGNNFDATVKIPMLHPHDIADVAADALHELSFTGKNIRYLVSDEKNGHEIAQLLGDAIGQPDLHWVAFTDDQLLTGMMQSGLSRHMASNYVEMGIALREGVVLEHYRQNRPRVPGKTSFTDFAREFAAVYRNTSNQN